MKSLLKNILIILIIAFISQEAFTQENAMSKFKKGTDYYSSGSYNEALETWIDIYNTGYRSSTLEYNIGNAYFKLNNIPEAILFYERAYLLDPANEDINYNLAIARSLNVDRFQEIPDLFFVRWYDFISLTLSSNHWAYISLASFIFSLLLLSLYIYSSKYRHKVLGFWLALLFILLSISSFAFASRNKSLVYDSHKAIISSPLVSGKSSPDASGTDLFVLHEGTKVTIEDELGGWYEIRLSDGNKGWIPVNTLNII